METVSDFTFLDSKITVDGDCSHGIKRCLGFPDSSVGIDYPLQVFSCGSAGNESFCNAGGPGLIPGLGRSTLEGKGSPLQNSGVNSMDCIGHRVTKSWTWLSGFHFTTSWKKSYEKPRQHVKKQRHYFTNKGLYSQSYGFSSSHKWIWEVDYKESWAPKNWCFWTVVLEKTLESPLDCKKMKPVNTRGNQPWIFIGRTDAEAEAPTLWPPDVKSQLTGNNPDAGKDWGQEEKRTTENEMVGWHHWFNGREFEQLLPLYEWMNEVAQSCLTLCDPMDHSLPGSCVQGIYQARILEWVAISFPRGSSPPRNRTQVSHIAGRRFTIWASREGLMRISFVSTVWVFKALGYSFLEL